MSMIQSRFLCHSPARMASNKQLGSVGNLRVGAGGVQVEVPVKTSSKTSDDTFSMKPGGQIRKKNVERL